MSKNNRVLSIVLALIVMAGAGVVSSLTPSVNPAATASSFLSVNAGETALYCTGLSNSTGGALGEVAFQNTTKYARNVRVRIVSNLGDSAYTSLHLAPEATSLVAPQAYLTGASFAVAALVGGAGVTATQETTNGLGQTQCTNTGQTTYLGTGFNTSVGSTAMLSLYNPTATPAVINVSTFTTNGFSAPQAWQGVSIAGHEQAEINLGTYEVAQPHIGLRVKVLRGALAMTGVQTSEGQASFVTTSAAPASKFWFPLVTTAQNAAASIEVANMSSQSTTVVAHVRLGAYAIPNQSVSLAPYSTGTILITPNPAIPAAGYAHVTVRSSVPVVASLITGSGTSSWLSNAMMPSSSVLVTNVTPNGLDEVALTNTLSSGLDVTIDRVASPSRGGEVHVHLEAGQTISLGDDYALVHSQGYVTIVLSASRPGLVVAATQATTTPGAVVENVLSGR